MIDKIEKFKNSKTYQDCSTIIITLSKEGVVPIKCVESWMNMRYPLNSRFHRIFVTGMEVGEGYSSTIEMILNHPELNKFKYILTIEEDNLPPNDGLFKLFENMDKFDVIGGLYWSKGEEQMPMVFGDIKEELNFRPYIATADLVPCYGIGMGFTLFKMEIFKDQRLKRPFFQTYQDEENALTQDLYFFKKINELGYKVACDTRVKVGHYGSGVVW